MRRFYLLMIVLCLSTSVFSQTLTFNGTSSTANTCQQNGSITVNVNYNTGSHTLVAIYYSIVAVKVGDFEYAETQSIAINNYTYSNIPAGNHRVQVRMLLSDASSVIKTINIVVENKYQAVKISAAQLVPSLLGCDSTGVMVVTVTGGKKPIKISIDTYTGSGLGNPVGREYDSVGSNNRYLFKNIPSGTYKFKIEDDCGSIDYITASLATINLSSMTNWIWSPTNDTEISHKWESSCKYFFQPKLKTGGTPDVARHYNKHPGFYFTYNDVKYPMGASILVDVPDSKLTGTLKIYSPCGQVSTRTFNQAFNFHYDKRIRAYHKNMYACDSLSVSLNKSTEGDSCRAKINGVEQAWEPVVTSAEANYPSNFVGTIDAYAGFSTGGYSVKELKEQNIPIEIQVKNSCGTIFPYAKFNLEFSWNSNNTFFYTCEHQNSLVLISSVINPVCFPAKYVLTNVETNHQYEKYIVNGRDTLTDIVDGTYNISLVDANGLDAELKTNYKIERKKPSFSYAESYLCAVEKSSFRLANMPSGNYRVQLIESPPGTDYYYDRTYKNPSLTVYPDDGDPGIVGNYKLKITNECGTFDTISFVNNSGYVIDDFSIDTLSVTCAGMEIRVNTKYHNMPSTVILNGTFTINGPVNFPSKPTGSVVLLNTRGEYKITFNTCLASKTIFYEGSTLAMDMNASVAFVCPESEESDGRIHAVAMGGDGNYTYYLSAKGTGGGSVISDPTKWIAPPNTIGEFYNSNLQKGVSYDVTIVDGCGSVRIQEFTIGSLAEIKLVASEKNPVCIGEPIQFRAMALPNPTYKWTNPLGVEFSTLSNPKIENAQLSDIGIYNVEITTSLCVQKIENIQIAINVQETPTLTLLSGTNTHEVCRGDNLLETVYKWGGSATDVTFTGNGLVTKKDIANKTITITGKPTLSFNYTLQTVGGCSQIREIISVKVSNTPTLNLASGNKNQIVCPGDNMAVKYNWTTITNDVAVTGNLPTGISYTIDYVAKELILSGMPTETGVFNYTVTATTTEPNNVCPAVVLTGTISVISNVTKMDTEASVENLTILVDVLANDDNVTLGALSLATVAFKDATEATKGTVTISDNKLQFIPNNSYSFKHAEAVRMVYEVKDSQNNVLCDKENAIVIVYITDLFLEAECSFNPKLNISLMNETFDLQWQKSQDDTNWTPVSGATSYTLPLDVFEDNAYYRVQVKKGTNFTYTKSVKLKVDQKNILNRKWYNVSFN